MRTQTTTASRGISPAPVIAVMPATLVADDGSQKIPSSVARARYAARISSSLTAAILPPLSSRAAIAFSHDAGLPMRMAVAMVSGDSMGRPRTKGAAPAAWKPSIRGRVGTRPAAAYSRNPAQ